MMNLVYVIYALLIFGLIVFVHELGHFLAARAAGIGVDEFALGFGPKLVGWKGRHTNYAIRLIPLGGYCKFFGEDGEAAASAAPRVLRVLPDSPAAHAGFAPGDVIVEVAGEEVPFDGDGVEQILRAVRAAEPGARISFAVERSGARITLQGCLDAEQLGLTFGRITENAVPRVLYNEGRSALAPGDVILEVAGEKIPYGQDGVRRIFDLVDSAAGARVPCAVLRGGERVALELDPVSTSEGPEPGLVMGKADYALPGDDTAPQKSTSFSDQNVWKRIMTVFSGPFMNFVLAYFAVVVYLLLIGYQFVSPILSAVTPGMGADRAGMKAGDVIVQVEGEDIAFSEAGAMRLRALIQYADPEEPIDFVVERAGVREALSVRAENTPDGYQIGITMGISQYRYGAGEALIQSGVAIKDIAGLMVDALRKLFTTGEGIEDTAGPVGLISVMTENVQKGFDMVLNLIVLISLNLGIVNLLPLPALDGGRLVFMFLEAVRGKPIKPQCEGWVHAAGFIALLGLIAVITFRDIAKLIAGPLG